MANQATMGDWDIKPTYFGNVTENPLRKLWEREQPLPNPAKTSIILQVGDPTVFRNLKPHPEWIEALSDAAHIDTFSYNLSPGTKEARQAVANYSKHLGKVEVEDVILTSGVSMALEICFLALANPGENILIPRPTWNYTTWTAGHRIDVRSYNLDPSTGWNVDLQHMESLIDENTKAILINQPGNPCGNVFSKDHILEIIAIAERHKLPIIADEVYEFFVFPGTDYHSFASLSKNVPILTTSGLTKRFLMPGIRMGWITVNDRGDKLKAVRPALMNIATRNFGPSSVVQKALPRILNCVPESFFADINQRVGKNALTTFKMLKAVNGLNPILPSGAMYLMLGIDFEKFPQFSSSIDFMRALANEQSVFVFPSECFNFEGFVRLCITAPEETLIEACQRIREFCDKHFTELIKSS